MKKKQPVLVPVYTSPRKHRAENIAAAVFGSIGLIVILICAILARASELDKNRQEIACGSYVFDIPAAEGYKDMSEKPGKSVFLTAGNRQRITISRYGKMETMDAAAKWLEATEGWDMTEYIIYAVQDPSVGSCWKTVKQADGHYRIAYFLREEAETVCLTYEGPLKGGAAFVKMAEGAVKEE